jgi:HlyD family secretion protein
MLKKRYVIIAILVVIVAIIFFSWLGLRSKSTSSEFFTEKVQLGDIKQTVSASGTLNPVILVNVGTQISGKVLNIYADFNDYVKANQILLELDPILLKSQLNQSQARLEKAKSSLELARANERRGKAVYEKKLLAKQDWEQLVSIRKSAEADVSLAESDLATSKADLDYATIRSPVSGVIVDREVDVGQTVAASFQTPTLFKIAQDLEKMQIDSSFAEADIANIKPGQDVDFTVDAFPNQTFKGVVKQIRLNPTIQQNVVTYDVVIAVENPTRVLLPGMTAYVTIVTKEHKNILTVPNTALRYKPKSGNGSQNTAKEKIGFASLYKIENKKLIPISFKSGISDSRNTEILSNELKEGDQVVTGEAQPGQAAAASTSSIRFRAF